MFELSKRIFNAPTQSIKLLELYRWKRFWIKISNDRFICAVWKSKPDETKWELIKKSRSSGNVIKLRNFHARKKAHHLFTKSKVVGIFYGLYVVKTAKAARIYFPIARYRNVTICPRVQVAAGEKLPSPVPLVMFFSTAQATACA